MKKEPLAATYISAKVLQVLTKHIAICTNQYFNPATSFDRRLAAASYLATIPLALRRINANRRYLYVRRGHELCERALSFANLALKASPRSTDLPLGIGVTLRNALRARVDRHFLTQTSLGTVWWLSKSYSVWDSPRVQAAASKAGLADLPARDPSSWKIWRYLNFDIPYLALRQTALFENIAQGTEGWIAEIIHQKSAAVVRRSRKIAGPVGRVARSLSSHLSGQIGLAQWVTWTTAAERSPFDPRLSEWTSLDITRQVTECVMGMRPEIRKEVVSSIFNFTVPQRWISERNNRLTWESWKAEIAGDHVKPKIRLRIRDARIMPVISDYPDMNLEFGSVRAIAAILLSLLRRNIRMPNYLVPTGYQGLLNTAFVRHIQERTCSSRTMAILESCLMDRSVETLWMKEGIKDADSKLERDIAGDVPIIQSLAELTQELKAAQNVLSGYQLTVSAHQPRQLIPINLEQYTKDNWRPQVDDTHAPEEDLG